MAILITKEGFEPVYFVVEADEVDTVARNKWLTAGVIWSPLWVGSFFTKKLKDSYDFILREESPERTSQLNKSDYEAKLLLSSQNTPK